MGVILVAVLLAYGASPQVKGAEGKSPLELVDEYRHSMARRLLERFI